MDFIDQFLTSNANLLAAVVAAMLAHGASLIWAVLRKSTRPAVATVSCMAGVMLAEMTPRLPTNFAFHDEGWLALFAFEALGLLASIASMCGVGIVLPIIWFVFASNFALSVGALLFILIF